MCPKLADIFTARQLHFSKIEKKNIRIVVKSKNVHESTLYTSVRQDFGVVRLGSKLLNRQDTYALRGVWGCPVVWELGSRSKRFLTFLIYFGKRGQCDRCRLSVLRPFRLMTTICLSVSSAPLDTWLNIPLMYS